MTEPVIDEELQIIKEDIVVGGEIRAAAGNSGRSPDAVVSAEQALQPMPYP